MLAYATTVHKSQGLSADYVEVHCSDMHYPGLLSVAISRVKSADGLRVVGLEAQHILRPNSAVMAQIECTSFKDFESNNSCCVMNDTTFKDTDFVYEFSDDEEPQSEHQTATADSLTAPSTSNAPFITELLHKQLFKVPVTSQQVASNNALQQLLNTDLSNVTDFMQTNLQSMYQATIAGKIKEGKPNSELFNEFASKMYNFSVNELTHRLEGLGIAEEYHKHMRRLYLHLKEALFDKETALLGEITLSKNPVTTTPKAPLHLALVSYDT